MPRRILEVALLSSFVIPGLLNAQPADSPASRMAFEVASIKPTAVHDGSFTINFPPGGRYSAKNVTVRNLLRTTYNVQDYQIEGGPDWLSSAGFDIEAKPAEGAGDLSRNQVSTDAPGTACGSISSDAAHSAPNHPAPDLCFGCREKRASSGGSR